jgi:hypothetical protein
MSLRHIEPTDVEHRNTIETDPAMRADRKVKAAQARFDKLVAANGAGPVLARAERALQDARLDVMERASAKNASARQKALAEAREKHRLEVERETLMRRSGMSPVLGMVFGSLRINAWPERSADPTVRSFAYGDWGKLMQFASTSTTRVAGIARKAGQPLEVFPLDVHRLRAEIEDLMRRSIAHGLVKIEEIED